MIKYDKLLREYETAQAAVKKVEESLAKKKVELADLVTAQKKAQETLLPMGQEVKAALVEHIAGRRADLTAASRALKEGNLLEAYRLVEGLPEPSATPASATPMDLLFILDTSGSMDGARYDYMIKGMQEVLQIDPRTKRQYAVVNFAQDTLVSRWSNNELPDPKTVSFQGNGTYLNPCALSGLCAQNSGHYAALLVTDGEFRDFGFSNLSVLNGITERGNKLGVLLLGNYSPSKKEVFVQAYGSFADVYSVMDGRIDTLPALMRAYGEHVLLGKEKPKQPDFQNSPSENRSDCSREYPRW